jgi:arylsulfatase A-like enzyme
MLFVDDLGYGDVGFNGHPTTATPNIDSLAWTGKVLTSWYSACPVCSCSRASLLTGRQWTRMGIPAVFNAVGNVGLPLNETTVATELKKGGYRTGVVGEWPCPTHARGPPLVALLRRRATARPAVNVSVYLGWSRGANIVLPRSVTLTISLSLSAQASGT